MDSVVTSINSWWQGDGKEHDTSNKNDK